MKNLTVTFPFLIFFLSSCSSGVTITASRLSGIIVDTTIAVDVGSIGGEESEKFRERLVGAVRANRAFGTPGVKPEAGPHASLLVEGTYVPTYNERSYEQQQGDETKEYVEKTWTARFEYEITDNETRELVIDGSLEESDSDTDEEGRGILGFIGDIISAIISGDPYSSLQDELVRRFIGEISPHEMMVDVTLFEDSDMPELETGIAQARSGQWTSALGSFLDAVEKHPGHKNLHKALYDAGVAYEYDHQYSLAWQFLEKAYQAHPRAEYREEIYRCRRYEQEWKWREGYLEKLRMVGRGRM